jgi:hypothetical protein
MDTNIVNNFNIEFLTIGAKTQICMLDAIAKAPARIGTQLCLRKFPRVFADAFCQQNTFSVPAAVSMDGIKS